MSERTEQRRGRRPAVRRRRAPPAPPAALVAAAEVPAGRRELAERLLALLRSGREAVDLSEEIEVLRQVLAELLMAEPDPRRLVSHVARLIDVEIRALRAQRLLGGGKSAALADTVAQLLLELGLGGEGEGG